MAQAWHCRPSPCGHPPRCEAGVVMGEGSGASAMAAGRASAWVAVQGPRGDPKRCGREQQMGGRRLNGLASSGAAAAAAAAHAAARSSPRRPHLRRSRYLLAHCALHSAVHVLRGSVACSALAMRQSACAGPAQAAAASPIAARLSSRQANAVYRCSLLARRVRAPPPSPPPSPLPLAHDCLARALNPWRLPFLSSPVLQPHRRPYLSSCRRRTGVCTRAGGAWRRRQSSAPML